MTKGRTSTGSTIVCCERCGYMREINSANGWQIGIIIRVNANGVKIVNRCRKHVTKRK